MTDQTITDLYADGGVIQKNPSPHGGTWAWCGITNDTVLATGSGVITPHDAGLPTITNNLTELLAIVQGLEAMPGDWCGTVYSDSWVSLQRVFLHARLRNVPQWLVDRVTHLRRTHQLDQIGYVLLDGHPTKAALHSGVGKRGHPVSRWNVWCDQECTRLAGLSVQADAPIGYTSGRSYAERLIVF